MEKINILREEHRLDENGLKVHLAHSTPLSYYQVIGERNSGTNFINWLVEHNTSLTPCDEFGWKHGWGQSLGLPKNMVLIVIVRHPLSWVKSMYHKPYHTVKAIQALDFSSFLRSTWVSVLDEWPMVGRNKSKAFVQLQHDRHPITGHHFKNVLSLRRAKLYSHTSWMIRNVNVALVRYEALNADPETMMKQLSRLLHVKMGTDFVLPNKRFGGRIRKAQPASPFSGTVTESDLEFIKSQLDADLEAHLGYDISMLQN